MAFRGTAQPPDCHYVSIEVTFMSPGTAANWFKWVMCQLGSGAQLAESGLMQEENVAHTAGSPQWVVVG